MPFPNPYNLRPFATAQEAAAAVPVFIDKAKGVPVDLGCALQAGDTIVSYGLSLVPHDDHPVIGAKPAAEKEVFAALETFAANVNEAKEGPIGQKSAVPWGLIIPLVVDFLLKWLRDRK